MIVKNEASVIRRCLDSVLAIVSQWVIVDTGLTDGTQDIVREHLRDLPGELHERPWRDFPPAAAYFYSPDRSAKHPTAHMAAFTGFLQADGYAGFEALYDPARTKPGPITEVACLAHCRRKFYDVWEATKSPVAKEALDRIAAVYAIEEKARFAPAAERVEHRRETAPLLEAFFDWSKATVVKLSGKSALAEAFRYTIKRQEALTRFVTDGRLEVDNNIAENSMRK
jgi:transposase